MKKWFASLRRDWERYSAYFYNIVFIPVVLPFFVKFENVVSPLAMTLVSLPVWYFIVFQVPIILFGLLELTSQNNLVVKLAIDTYYLADSVLWYCVIILTIFYVRATVMKLWDKKGITAFLKGNHYD